MLSVRVKICGITSVQDALAAVEAGADALGLMFYEPSPRCLTLAAAKEIVRELPPFVAKVGVFVNAPEERVRKIAAECHLDTLQFHGEESPGYCGGFDCKVIKAFRVRDAASLESATPYDATGVSAWLLDTYVAGQHGGTGQAFNWALASEAVMRNRRIILAGGLTPENVSQAVAEVHPYGVDVSSGVESQPGRKDPQRMRAFVAAAKCQSIR